MRICTCLAAMLVVSPLFADPPEKDRSVTIKPVNERFQSLDTEEVPSFQQHVLPLLGRLGCNGRACHGSFQGQGGFRLSLFGYDFKLDHTALLEGEKPRVDKEDPFASLILEKPTLTMPHKGGKRLEPDGWEYNLIARWIESGSKAVSETAPQFERLEVTPKEVVFTKAGEEVQVRAIAHWSDGRQEDVTPICRFRTNDESISEVSENGVVKSLTKGDTHIITFYDNGIASTQTILPVSSKVDRLYPRVPTPTAIDSLVVKKLKKLGIVPSDKCSDEQFIRRVSLDLTGTLPSPTDVKNFVSDRDPQKFEKKIDELLNSPGYAFWWTNKLCDVTGNNEQVGGENQFRRQFAAQWYDWIYKRVSENEPYDELVAGIVVATSREGDQTYQEYAASMSDFVSKSPKSEFVDRETMPHFWARNNVRQPADKALSFAHAFLGVRIQCAQCHKHPFDQWTQDDYKQFTAFFNGVTYGPTEEYRTHLAKMQKEHGITGRGNQVARELAKLINEGETIPWRELYINSNAVRGQNRRKGASRNELKRLADQLTKGKELAERQKDTNKSAYKSTMARLRKIEQRITQIKRQQKVLASRVVTPKLLGGDEVVMKDFGDPRAALMEWMRQDTNPYFARAFVNRVWANYFGVGIIDPPDDQNLANPPSNPELLTYLTRGFVDNGYDMKWLHKTITSSRTYQLSSKTNETNELDNHNFSHALIRRLPAEIMFDSLVLATGSDAVWSGYSANKEQRTIGLSGTLRGRGRNSNSSVYALTLFGKPNRVTNCDCERSDEPSLLQTVFMRNDFQVLAMIDREDGWLSETLGAPTTQISRRQASQTKATQKRIAEMRKRVSRLQKSGKKKEAAAARRSLKKLTDLVKARTKQTERAAERRSASSDPSGVIAEAYLRTVSRLPTSEEEQRAKLYLSESANMRVGARDLIWALLNTKEFMTNH